MTTGEDSQPKPVNQSIYYLVIKCDDAYVKIKIITDFRV